MMIRLLPPMEAPNNEWFPPPNEPNRIIYTFWHKEYGRTCLSFRGGDFVFGSDVDLYIPWLLSPGEKA